MWVSLFYITWRIYVDSVLYSRMSKTSGRWVQCRQREYFRSALYACAEDLYQLTTIAIVYWVNGQISSPSKSSALPRLKEGWPSLFFLHRASSFRKSSATTRFCCMTLLQPPILFCTASATTGFCCTDSPTKDTCSF